MIEEEHLVPLGEMFDSLHPEKILLLRLPNSDHVEPQISCECINLNCLYLYSLICYKIVFSTEN